MDITKELEEYFKNTPKEQIEKDWAKSLSLVFHSLMMT
jgi:hypothetical protein